MPIRNLPVILGKLVMSLKYITNNYDFSRNYELKKEKYVRDNEFALEITRGKTLACLLNYSHITTVRYICAGIIAMIGDGRANLQELAARGIHVPIYQDTIVSSIQSVFNVKDLHEIETINHSWDRAGLNSIKKNLSLTHPDCIIKNIFLQETKAAPLDVSRLYNQIEITIKDWAIYNNAKIDLTLLHDFHEVIEDVKEKRKHVNIFDAVATLWWTTTLWNWDTITKSDMICLSRGKVDSVRLKKTLGIIGDTLDAPGTCEILNTKFGRLIIATVPSREEQRENFLYKLYTSLSRLRKDKPTILTSNTKYIRWLDVNYVIKNFKQPSGRMVYASIDSINKARKGT